MQIEIISPESTLFTGDVKQVRVPGSIGSFAVLHNHAPITSTLEKGVIKITQHDGEEVNLDILGGVIQVKNNNVKILVFSEEN
ncbi:MAG: ATP synthase F1 subunit epsilon [Salinivirgaceae bacterium]|jgi:F-type H+-transporting ATPase subunit epsilon|nr:ATP synthase F1 subunit epsilon [Bacteroidales bacterium]